MGSDVTYKVNDDGSVTMAKQPSEQEQYILDIFRIEKAKGGVFASRRMKKRALKYAKSAGVPEFMVEKLMMDHYGTDFANYGKTTQLIVWAVIAAVFVLTAYLPFFWVYYEYERVADQNHYIDKIEAFQRSGYNMEYWPSFWGNYAKGYEPSREKLDGICEDGINEFKRCRNNRLQDMFGWLLGLAACAGAVYFAVGRCRKLAASLRKQV